MSINSSSYKDMRVIRIRSNYVLGNMTDLDNLSVATLAVPSSKTNLPVPAIINFKCVNVRAATSSSRFVLDLLFRTIVLYHSVKYLFFTLVNFLQMRRHRCSNSSVVHHVL